MEQTVAVGIIKEIEKVEAAGKFNKSTLKSGKEKHKFFNSS